MNDAIARANGKGNAEDHGRPAEPKAAAQRRACTFVVTGGGTAGHINPALALAEELQARGHTVLYAGTPDGLEARLAAQAQLPFVPFEAAGFDRARPHTLLTSSMKIASSERRAKAWLREVEPAAVVAFGGYVCLPVGTAAVSLKVPLVIHEQNSVMGLANRELSKHAAKVCLTYGCARGDLPEQRVVVTGNPVRRSVREARREDGRRYLGIPDDALVLLVFGGSRGARHINTAIARLKGELLAQEGLHVVHITGPKEYDAVREQLALTPAEERRYHTMDYCDRMGEVLAAADCIVSRAGATSLAEIAARAIPAILVPFPYATADHQTTNARAWCEAGCALMVADDAVEESQFADYVKRLVQDAALREDMASAARAGNAGNAAAMLADAVELEGGCMRTDEQEESRNGG